MNTVIIAAGGRGTRLDPARPKQFLELLGKPIIIHTLERFEHCAAIDEIVLVLPADELNDFLPIAEAAGISKLKKIVVGGATRAQSVRNGFEATDVSSAIVTVHDGVRPLVSSDEIALTIDKALQTGAACLVAPVTDTIKTVENNTITGTVDRAGLRRALTPQAFRYDILRKALANGDLGEDVTDECYLAEKLGVEIGLVEGSPHNIKITHAGDLQLAELFMKQDA